MSEVTAEYKVAEKPDYYTIPRMSNSAMTYFKKSPKHYLHYISEKDKMETTAMLLGRAFHCAVLENDFFGERYITEPEGIDRRTTAGKAAYTEFMATAKGKSILSADESNKILEMADALYAYEPARDILNSIQETEKELFWTDEITQTEMKGKLDGYYSGVIIDVKTTQDAQPDKFGQSAYNYDYHRQAAVYIDGCKALGIPAKEFYFIAIEKEKPYGISVMKASKEFIQKGREQYEQILQDYLYWKNSGSPNVGYEFRNPFSIFDLNLPNWIK